MRQFLLPVLCAFLCTYSNQLYSQIDNVGCNQVYGKALITDDFDDLSVNASETDFSNEDNILDSDTTNFAEENVVLSEPLAWIEVEDDSDSYPAGTFAGFRFSVDNLISFGDLEITTYLGDTQQESQNIEAGGIVGTAGVGSLAGFVTTQQFDRIRLTYTAVGAASTINVYYAVVNRFCEGDDLECNINTNLQAPDYPAIINSDLTGLNGITVGSIANTDHLLTPDDDDAAQLNFTVAALSTASVAVENVLTDYPAGTWAGFEYGNPNLLEIETLNNLSVTTYLDGTEQESVTGAALIANAPLLDNGDRQIIGFETTAPFDALQFTVTKPANVSVGTTNLYNAIVKRPCEGPALACNENVSVSTPEYPVDIGFERTGFSGAVCAACEIEDADNVIDGDAQTAANMNFAAGVLATGSLSVKKSLTSWSGGTFVGFDIENPNLLNAEVLANITLTTFEDGTETESVSGTGLLVGAATDLLAEQGRATIGFVTTSDFDEAVLSVEGVAETDLGTLSIYDFIVSGICEGEINCDEGYYLTRPEYPVFINIERTGEGGVACAACGVSGTENVIDEDLNNFAQLNLGVGVLGSASLSVIDPTVDYPAGTYVGFTVADNSGLVRADLLEQITIRTYLDGTLQESATSTDLLDLALLGLTEIGNGTFNIGFVTTQEFDEVQIEVEGLVNVLNTLDVYSAFVDTRFVDTGDGGPLDCSQDSDEDGIPDTADIDIDNDGIPNVVEQAGATNGGDTDNDGVNDEYDLDSDGDGILDIEEGNSPTGDLDDDGTPNEEDPDYNNPDADGDGRVDDTSDTDGDGLADLFDQNPASADDPQTEQEGLDTTTQPVPDTDNDNAYDFQDVDADNDSISDVVEGGNDPSADTDGDGRLDTQTDTDGDGISDIVDPDNGGTPADTPDTDADGRDDYRDLDSDNDSINDVDEADPSQETDPDADGMKDDPLNIITDPNDADNDNTFDFREIDSDDDGTNDVEDSTPYGDTSTPPQSQDASADGNSDGVVDDTTDSDNDGIANPVDGLPGEFGDAVEVLPVELLAFYVETEESTARLKWVTATETSNSHYEIQRSIDGVNFEQIGVVEGAGTTQQEQVYNYTDEHAASLGEQVFYRLKQVDLNGHSDYSQIRVAEFISMEVREVTLFPNPAEQGEQVVVQAKDIHTITVFNNQGVLVKRLNFNQVQNTVSWKTGSLSAGIYVVVINETIPRKIVIK